MRHTFTIGQPVALLVLGGGVVTRVTPWGVVIRLAKPFRLCNGREASSFYFENDIDIFI